MLHWTRATLHSERRSSAPACSLSLRRHSSSQRGGHRGAASGKHGLRPSPSRRRRPASPRGSERRRPRGDAHLPLPGGVASRVSERAPLPCPDGPVSPPHPLHVSPWTAVLQGTLGTEAHTARAPTHRGTARPGRRRRRLASPSTGTATVFASIRQRCGRAFSTRWLAARGRWQGASPPETAGPCGRRKAGTRPLEGRRPLWEGGLLTRSAPARLFSPGARASRAAHAGGAGPRAPSLPRGRSPLARPGSRPRGRCAHASARRAEERPPGRVPTRVPRRPRPRPQVPDVCPLRPATGPRTGGVRKPLRRLRPGAAGGCSGTNRSDGSCRSRRQGGAARAGEGRGDSGLCCPAELTARRRVRGGAPCALPDPTPSPAAHEEPQVSARAGQAAPPAPRPDSSPTRVAGHVPPCVCVSVRGDVHTRVQPQKQGARVLDRASGARPLGTRRHVRFVPGTPRAAEAAWL